jgi:steroid 5-alpha reductase family enzyme
MDSTLLAGWSVSQSVWEYYLHNGSSILSSKAILPPNLSAVDSSFAANILLVLFFSFLTWILAILTSNYSWTDRIWSLTPFLYAWVFYIYNSHSERLAIMTALSTLWGLRLSYNFYRKGN